MTSNYVKSISVNIKNIAALQDKPVMIDNPSAGNKRQSVFTDL